MNIQFNARAGDDDACLLSLGKALAEAEERYKLLFNNWPDFESNSEKEDFSRILGEASDLVRKLRKLFYNIQARTNAGLYLKRLNAEPPSKADVEPKILSFVGEWRAALAEYDKAEALYFGKNNSCLPRFKARRDRANASINDLRAKIIYMNAPTAECIFFKAEVAAQYHSGVFVDGACECYDDENQTKDFDNSDINEEVMLYILDRDFKNLLASTAANNSVQGDRPDKVDRSKIADAAEPDASLRVTAPTPKRRKSRARR